MYRESISNKIEAETSEKKEKILIIDITEEVKQVIHQLAEEATAKYLNSLQENNGKWFITRFFKGIVNFFKRSFAELSRSYLYHSFRKQIEEEVKNNYNLFQRIVIAGKNANVNLEDKEKMSEFLRLALERFEANIADRFSRDIEIGETIDSTQNIPALKDLIVQIFRDFINNPNLDTPAGRIEFNKEFSRRLKILIEKGNIPSSLFYGREDKRIASSPEMFSTNIYEYIVSAQREIKQIAQSNYLVPEQEKQLNDYVTRLANIDVQLGRLASSVRTKIPDAGKKGTSDYTLSRLEELCLKLENVPILSKIINPLTVGFVSSIISKEGLIKLGGRGLAAMAAGSVLGSIGYLTAPILTGAALAGIFAYYRSKTRFKQDAGRILREQASGLEITDPKAKKVLEKIALSGGDDFRKLISELIQGIKNKDENAYKQAVARLELEFESRKQESPLPQLDLLISNGQWRSSFIEKYELEKVILEFESSLSQADKDRLRKEIESIKNELADKILSQDKKIKKEAQKIGLKNGILTGALAFALGSSIQYIRDLIGETEFGQKISESFLGQIIAIRRAKEKISLIEYILGERPRAGSEGYTTIIANSQEIIVYDHEKNKLVEKIINLPDGNWGIVKFDPQTQKWILDLSPEAKSAGWVVTEKGFELNKPGVKGSILENWGEIKKLLNLKTEKVGWVDFAWEKKPPEVVSWEVPPDHPGFNAEGLELSMSFQKSPDGDVYIKVPVAGTAFREGGPSWDIAEYVKQGKAMVVISPRDRILQHDALIFEVKPEDVKGCFAEVKIPKDLANIFFIEEGGKLRPNGAQITYNLEVALGSDGKHKLVEIAADYNPKATPISVGEIHEEVPVIFKDTPPIPPTDLNPAEAIPLWIDWWTRKTGQYKEPSSEIPPQPVKPPEYFYYNTHYWSTVEWIRKFSKNLPENLKDKFNELLKEKENIEEIRKIKMEMEKQVTHRYIEDWDNDINVLLGKEILNKLFVLNNFEGESYQEFIKYLASKIPPMKAKTRVAIFIPAYHEEKFIGRCLAEYIKQKDLAGKQLDPDLYEIVILDNKKEGEDWDNTQKEIENIKNNNPNINIHYLKVEFPKEIGGVGLARRILTDIILYRSFQRDLSDGPLYLISEDADLEVVDEKIVIKTIERFDKYPQIDVLKGIEIRNPEILSKHDLLLFERMGSTIRELLFRSHFGLDKDWYKPEISKFPNPFSWARIISGGWATAISALALAEIGGYDPRLKVGEDLFIGNALSIARSESNDIQGRPIPNLKPIKTFNIHHSSSMRRFILQLFKNVYGEFGSEKLEKEIRELKDEDILKLDIMKKLEVLNSNNVRKFEEYINWWIQHFYILTQNKDEAKRRSNLLLRLFLLREDFDYKWQDDKIILNDSTAINRIKLSLELFKLYVKKFGYRAMVRTKLGIWPVWSGFKVPLNSKKGTFELIYRIGRELNKNYNSNISVQDLAKQENEIIDQFLKLSEDVKLKIIENLILVK